MKLGISNVVTVIALYKFGWKEAASVSVIRIVVAGLLFNGAIVWLTSSNCCINLPTALIAVSKRTIPLYIFLQHYTLSSLQNGRLLRMQG